MNQENTRKLWLYNLIADNRSLPKGTRINTTEGGIPTGGNHELSDNLLKAANKVPNHLSYYVPFWILGWRDLHDDLLPPMEADVPEEEVLHQTAPGAKIIRHESAAMICPKCGVNKESTLRSIKLLLKERDKLRERVEQLETKNNMPHDLDAIRQAIEERDAALQACDDLANQMIYHGNSVGWWYSKAVAYRDALDRPWGALKAAGIHPDGKTDVATAIRQLAGSCDDFRERGKQLEAENKRLRDELATSRELKQMWQNRACQAERMLK